jgi:hypothetical protein
MISMPTYRLAATTPAEKELTQAVRRVVEHYGSDLTGYFRHVEEIAKKNAKQSGPKESQETNSESSSAGKSDNKSAS